MAVVVVDETRGVRLGRGVAAAAGEELLAVAAAVMARGDRTGVGCGGGGSVSTG